ncbi:MAG: hypothetical protein GY772_17675 [bacterium]|nr:hypothetical protein [bacterium]
MCQLAPQGGWHPDHLAINCASGNLTRIVETLVHQWPAVRRAGQENNAAAIVCYCREGNIRSVAMVRHLYLALSSCGFPAIPVVQTEHVSRVTGRWAESGRCTGPGGPSPCGPGGAFGPCDECTGRLADDTIITTMRDLRNLWRIANR